MADVLMGDTQFSDEEVQEILRRAVSAGSSEMLTPGEGLSLDDLKAIGEEVGIEPSSLDTAALSVVRERRPAPGRLLGGPRVLDLERAVSGKLATSAFPSLLSTIRRTLGQKGDATEIQGSLEWSAKSETIDSYVTLSTAGDHTTIRASANLSGLASVTFLPAGFLGVISAMFAFIRAADAANEVGMVFCLLAIPTLYMLLRTIFGRIAAAEAAKLERVVDELAHSIAGGND